MKMIFEATGMAMRLSAIYSRFKVQRFKVDKLVKSRKGPFFVIPAEAGIQYFQRVTKNLDPVFQRGDDFLRNYQGSAVKTFER
jgi:hypothetical protein